jgi:hypothetical protein
MNLNLDTLRTEILEYLEAEGFVIFQGYSRLAETDSFVAWDVDRLPDFKTFLSAAKNAGVRLIVFHYRQFSSAHLEDGTERLEESELGVEERRSAERRLRELSEYEGFTCAIELSFDYQGRVYLFSVRSDWYDEYLDLLEDLDASLPDEDGHEDDSMGGYYSKN